MPTHNDSMRDFIHNKIEEKEPWNPEDVLFWMKGQGLPPVGHSEEFYIWLWRGIEQFGEEAKEKITGDFARKLAECRQGIHDILMQSERPERFEKVENYRGQVAANLWTLMALLRQPSHLGPVVDDAVARLPGTWLSKKTGIERDDNLLWYVRERLVNAAVLNQHHEGRDYVPEWKKMIDGKGDETPFMAGDSLLGRKGLELAPPRADAAKPDA